MQKALKVRIYPTDDQVEFLTRQFGAVRFVYNKALRIMNHQYRRHGKSLNAKKHMKPLLAVAKKHPRYDWLKEPDSMALQQACINLDKAFQNFFNTEHPARYPKPKKKHGRQSSYHCTNISAGDDWIKIPKIKSPIKAKIHREMKGKLSSITLERTVTGKYYASLLYEDGREAPAPLTDLSLSKITAIDLGVSHLAITSNGRKIINPRFLINAYRDARRKQKALSRCKKGSAGRAKARLALAKAHERLANARKHFQHVLSRHLIDENQAVIVETLRIKNMLKNRKLARYIADAAWGSLLEKIAYKAKEAGKHFVKVDQWFASSKTCHVCHHKMDEMPLSIRAWQCPSCNTSHDRDINAALNIKQQGVIMLKAAGLTVSANGGLRKSS